MEIAVTIKDDTPELWQKVEAAVGRFVKKGAAFIEKRLKESMEGPKSGRAYVKKSGKVHIASAPGESPAVDTSNLIGSIEQIFPSTLEAKIGTPVEYALYLEGGAFATQRKVHAWDGQAIRRVEGPTMGGMLARPLWQKTATESLPTLEKMLQAELKGV